jgi:hypothetical protein
MIVQRHTIDELAADPDVQRALARIPRGGRALPIESYNKVRMKEVGPWVAETETSLAAAHANIKRMEHEIGILRHDVARLAQMILKNIPRHGMSEEELMFALRKETRS